MLIHGFTLDGEGRKMSKSLGNVIAPQEVIERYGAEVLRLWVAMSDSSSDVRLSEEILSRTVEAYRKVRNTCRFILGNLDAFDPRRHALPAARLWELDRWALGQLVDLERRVRRAYEEYAFHETAHALHQFCVITLSSFYLDVLKDRLYTFGHDSEGRRSAQTALEEIGRALALLMAPVLSFTAEEVWQHLPRRDRDSESVHLGEFPSAPAVPEDPDLEERWARLQSVRSEVAKHLEAARQAGKIGSALEARVRLISSGSLRSLLERYLDQLPAILIVSQVELEDGPQGDVLAGGTWSEGRPADSAPGSTAAPSGQLAVEVRRALGQKCERCWNYSTAVGSDRDLPALCHRCLPTVRAILASA